jgi:hypothetical protein
LRNPSRISSAGAVAARRTSSSSSSSPESIHEAYAAK